MPENSDVAVVRESYDALAKADLDRFRDSLLGDDVVFHVPGRGALAGDHTGKEQVLDYLGRLCDQVGGSLQLEPDSFIAEDGRVAVLLRVTGERNGRTLDERGVHVFRVTGGKVSERWSFPHDSYVIDEFFS